MMSHQWCGITIFSLVMIGIPQGSSLSPILYLSSSAGLVEAYTDPELTKITPGLIDDVATLTCSDSAEANLTTLQIIHARIMAWTSTHDELWEKM